MNVNLLAADARAAIGEVHDDTRPARAMLEPFRFVPDFADEPTAAFFATLGIGPRARRP